MKTESTNLLLLTISAFWSSSRWPLATSMSSRRQISIPFGGRYRQVLLYMQVSKRFDKWAIDFVQMKFYENWVWDALRADILHYNSPLYIDDLMEDAAGVILSTGSAGERHPDSKVHGANMGPIWGRQDPGGPHAGPMNFVIWAVSHCNAASQLAGPIHGMILGDGGISIANVLEIPQSCRSVFLGPYSYGSPVAWNCSLVHL